MSGTPELSHNHSLDSLTAPTKVGEEFAMASSDQVLNLVLRTDNEQLSERERALLDEVMVREPHYAYPTDLKHFLAETMHSNAAEQLLRFHWCVEPGSKFPYEGDDKSHATGSYIRGNWMMHDEVALGATYHHPPLLIPEQRGWQKIKHEFHDLGELALPGEAPEENDIPHGLKTEVDRVKERARFLGHAERVRESNPRLYAQLMWTLRSEKNPEDTIAGQFGKAVEHIGFLETARRLHERYVLDGNRTNDQINRETRVYLRLSFLTDPAGQPIEPSLKGTHALIADILANSGERTITASKKFLSVRKYVWHHRAELQSLYNEYLINAQRNAQLLDEVYALKGYCPAASGQHRTRQEASKAMMTYLDHLQGYSLDEALALRYDGLTPLAEGRMVEVTR